MAIAVTERAVAEIKKAATARAEHGASPKGLRVGIRGGGCTGFSYLFEWSDSEPRPEDKVLSFEEGAVRVFVDPKSFIYLDGSTLEYATSMMGRGFKFTNPNVKGTCGCGESVQF
jgi:iron-sulfur cluster assembly protein